ncbi:MAG: bifunctional lysylphosphatidylglycerol flippase/synthetase MprF [Lagierella massiliensis]|nr:bifunctional lysylphosphatidylglycerol flippase/synthetase MprF [Lagierella massiliensis]
MEKIKIFYRKYKNYIRTILVLLVIFISAMIIKREIAGINLNELKQILLETDIKAKVFFIVFGIFAFSFATIYDFLLAKYYKMNIPIKEVFIIGWISQSFNNFIGFGGVAGFTIRELMYDKYKVDKKVINRILFIVIFSDMIGLFSLGLPSAIGLIQRGKYKLVPILFIMFIMVILFIFIDKIDLSKYISDERSIFIRAQRKLRLYISIQSTFEWFLAALFFAFTIRYFEDNISILTACTVYVIATIVGIISLIPGGLGSFEACCVFVFNLMGYSTPKIVISLLICRICYTIIPWIVGLLLLVISTKGQTDQNDVKKQNAISTVLSYSVLATGGLIVVSMILPQLFIKIKFITKLFPNYMLLLNKRFTLICGLSLMALASGIKNRVKIAHRMAIIFLIILSMLYLIMGKGYLEAVICTVLTVALYVNRSYFDGLTENLSFRKFFKITITTFIIFILIILIYNIRNRVNFLYGMEKFSIYFIKNNLVHVLFPPMVTLAIASIFLGVKRKYMTFEKLNSEDLKKFEDFFKVNSFVENTHSFYLRDKNIFFNSKKTVMFLYRPYRDKIFVLGDPAGNVKDFDDALDEFIKMASKNKMDVVFFQITGKYLENFVNQGFSILKIGEDAKVDLTNFSMEGKKFKILRRTLNSMETKNLQFKIHNPPFAKEFLFELKNISDEWLDHRREMQFSIGFFDEKYLQKAPIFTIEDDDKIYAFANMFPLKGTKTVSIDLMRHLINSPDGVMDMMFLNIIKWAKENGYEKFDLGVAPLSNVGNKIYSTNKEKTVKLAYKYGNKIYGFQGLRRFKNKYTPEWSSVFLAYKDDLQLPDTLIKLVNVTYGYGNKKDINYLEEITKEFTERNLL